MSSESAPRSTREAVGTTCEEQGDECELQWTGDSGRRWRRIAAGCGVAYLGKVLPQLPGNDALHILEHLGLILRRDEEETIASATGQRFP